MATDLHVVQVRIADLSAHPRNPRRGDVAVIADSLKVNGQYRPIVVASDGVVLAGNHTLAAARTLGWDTIAVVRLPIASDSIEARRIMLADNRTADLGLYDDSALLDLLNELEADLAGTGYDDTALDALARLVTAQGYGRVDPDAEWAGMPEFAAENLPDGVMRVVVHIHTDADVASFFAAIGGEPRATVFWPEPWDREQRFWTSANGPVVRAGDANSP